jgi:HAD superfamily hydrolase (TIGR01509 family)
VIEAVHFDWGDTLMPYDSQADDAFVHARTVAGLAALDGRVNVTPEAIAGWFREHFDELFASDAEEDFDHLEMLARCFRDLGAELSEADVRVYAEASLWEGEMLLFPHAHALLDALRARGLKTAIVSNTSVPGWLLEPVLEKQGLASRIDAAVFSSDVGKRKPHPLIFEHALRALGVGAERALMVGDRLYEDVRGAGELGLTTVQALWFRADEHSEGREPDFRAFTQMDVLNIVDRVAGAG